MTRLIAPLIVALVLAVPRQGLATEHIMLHCGSSTDGSSGSRNEVMAKDGSWMQVSGKRAKRQVVNENLWLYSTMQSNGKLFSIRLSPNNLFIIVKNGELIIGMHHCFPVTNPFAK